jgi:hypothetical protein
MMGKKRSVGIVVLFLNNFGMKGFYQSQEFGLADAFARAGYDIDVYKCTSGPSFEESNGYPVYYMKVGRFGTHSLFDPNSFFKRK